MSLNIAWGFEEKFCSCDFWCVDFWVVTDDMLHLGLFGQASAGFGFGFGCRLLHALEQF